MSDLAYIEEAAPRWPWWKSGDGGGSERREIEERMSKRYARELGVATLFGAVALLVLEELLVSELLVSELLVLEEMDFVAVCVLADVDSPKS